MRRLGSIIAASALVLLCSGCTLYGWGFNELGQLGDGTSISPRPDPIAAARNPDWITIDAGRAETCGIDVDHALYCWGLDTGGELGNVHEDPSGTQTNPTRVGAANDWSAVSAGGYGGGFVDAETAEPGQTCGIRAGGELYCWGLNGMGQLGDGTMTTRFTPTRVGAAGDWSQVSTGAFHTCGVRSGGALYCWGDNTHGQLGTGSLTGSTTPVRVGTAADWTVVSAGYTAHTCGIRSGGALYCWGDNTDGQLGDNTTIERTVPKQVGTATDWTIVSTGGAGLYDFGFTQITAFTCGTRAGGELFCWGDNSRGELGDGTMTNRFTPTRVGSAGDWRDISVGAFHACGIRSDRSLYCWGSNALGDGHTTNSATPVQNELGGWTSVTTGIGHTEGLRG